MSAKPRHSLNPQAPIGVFDSGVGGLSVLQHLRQQLPDESYIYIADSHYTPYGERSPADILQRCELISDYLHGFCKAIVIACNTATSVAASPLRERWPDYTIIGMEPGIKPALAQSKTGNVGVLATTGTLNGEKYQALRAQLIGTQKIIEQPCPGLVEAIEQADTKQQQTLLQQYLQPLLEANCDVVVFGCTHYPFLRPIAQQLAPQLQFIDTGSAVAAHLHQRLESADALASANILNGKNLGGDCHCYTSGDVAQFNQTARALLGQPMLAGPFDL